MFTSPSLRHAAVIGIALIAGLFSAPSFACRFIPSTEPLNQRMAQSPLLFIGTVQSINDGQATFSVEQLLRHRPEALKEQPPEVVAVNLKDSSRTVVIKLGKSSCDTRYEVGSRWVWAGGSVMSPSVLLGLAGRPDAADYKLNAKPSIWPKEVAQPAGALACTEDAQCTQIIYGCKDPLPVNSSYVPSLTPLLHKKYGDPRAISCYFEPPKGNDPIHLPGVACVQKQCTHLTLQFTPPVSGGKQR